MAGSSTFDSLFVDREPTLKQLRRFQNLLLFFITISSLGSILFFIFYNIQSGDTDVNPKMRESSYAGPNLIVDLQVDDIYSPLLSNILSLELAQEMVGNQVVLDEPTIQHKPKTSLKVILYWNSWDPSMGNQVLTDNLCPVTSCIFTAEKSLLNQSHVILFFVDNNGMTINSPLPPHRQAHQRFVFAIHDGTPAASSHIDDDHIFLYNYTSARFDFFNWTMTYRSDSDVVMRQTMGSVVPISYKNSYQRKPSKMLMPSNHWMKRPSKSVRVLSGIRSKNKLIAWFPKKCTTSIRREDYVRQLSQYIPVDIYGKCANLSCDSSGCSSSEPNFEMLRSEYKFYLAFEEFWCPDYVTQEFYKALDFDTVPVVLGGADYDRLAPPHSFINVLDFSSVEALAEYLLLLDKNEELYVKFFDWQKNYDIIINPMGGWCDLCRMAHDDDLPPKIYHDIKQWWIDDGRCENDYSEIIPKK